MAKLFNPQKAVYLGIVLVLLLCANAAYSDQIFYDDVLIVGDGGSANPGALCVGNDCSNGENFDSPSYTKLRIKENNIRLHFQDTSNPGGSYNSNDWRIMINSFVDGGAGYFAIEDTTAGVIPFIVYAGAPADSLVIDAAGNVGLGASSPTEALDVQGNAFILGNLEMGSSRSYKKDIRSLEKEQAMATLKALRPVKYFHKSNPDEESVGFIAEEVPDLVATNSRKSLNPVDIVAVLTKVCQEQNRTIEKLSTRLDALEKRQHIQ